MNSCETLWDFLGSLRHEEETPQSVVSEAGGGRYQQEDQDRGLPIFPVARNEPLTSLVTFSPVERASWREKYREQ